MVDSASTVGYQAKSLARGEKGVADRARGACEAQKSAMGIAVTTMCAPARTTAASEVKLRVRLAAEVSTSGGGVAPERAASSAGAAVDAPSKAASTSPGACRASACTTSETA